MNKEKTVAALFVDPEGPYKNIPEVDSWDEARDARLYEGNLPVVCHPPCNRWGKMAPINFKRWGTKVGEDSGCFESALFSIRRCFGVLEHPAQSIAWDYFGLVKPPSRRGWLQTSDLEWVVEVYQSDYGHLATKKTWLYYVGSTKPEKPIMNYTRGVYQVGGGIHTGNNKKPRMPQHLTHITPQSFANYLFRVSKKSRGIYD